MNWNPEFKLRDYQAEGCRKACDGFLEGITQGEGQHKKTIAGPFTKQLGIAATGAGKAQPMDAMILTPRGWSTMADVELGAQVIGADGLPANVVGVFPQGLRQIYEVHFSDGTMVECASDHLWEVNTKSRKSRKQSSKILETKELISDVLDGGGAAKWFIPVPPAIDFECEWDIPVDPWVFGILLGDGSFRNYLSVSLPDEGVKQAFESKIRRYNWRLALCEEGKTDYRINGAQEFKEWLKIANLWGRYSYEKHLPNPDMPVSIENRLALVQGLMDSDGTRVDRGNRGAEFNTSSPLLAGDVLRLFRSLGVTTQSRTRKDPKYTHKGEVRTGREAYRITWNGQQCPFLHRTNHGYVSDPKRGADCKAIVAIKRTAYAADMQCIAIDHPRHLYVTDGYTLTHNTILAAALAYWEVKRGGRVLMLAHTDELCDQAQEKIFAATGLYSSIEKSNLRASLDAPIVTGSFQSFGSGDRIDRFPPNHFGLVVADEAHLSIAPTFLKTLKYFHKGGANVFGITATPERADLKSLMEFYEHVSFEVKMLDLIQAGHLAPLTVQTCPLKIDVKGVDLEQQGEDNEELAAAITPYYDAIIDEWLEHAADRPTVVFHPSRYSSRTFTQLLLKRGINAAHIDGDSKRRGADHPKGESLDRKEILKQFSRGEIHVLNNAQLLTAGWDEPRIECVMNLRLTRHRTPYTQIIGRGTRLNPGKNDCLVLDFLWQFDDINIFRPIDLFTEAKEVRDIAQRRSDAGGKFDLANLSVEAQREREQLLIDRMEQKRHDRGQRIDVREFAASMHQPELLDYEPRAEWEKAAPSDAQKRLFDGWGVDAESIGSRGLASKLVGLRMKNHLATAKQVAWLRDLGVEFDIGKLTVTEAATLIKTNT